MELPSYIPIDVVTPDLPDPGNGAPTAFLAYPEDPKPLHDGKPSSGGTISILHRTVLPPVPSVDNPYLEEINERVGATLNITQVNTGYAQKFATVVAGGDIPDIMSMGQATRIPEFLESTCQDLSEELSGSAVEKYPSLAAMSTVAWRNMVYNDKIFGVPYCFNQTGSLFFAREDLVEQAGHRLDEVSDGEDFRALCRDVTDPVEHRWAITHAPALVRTLAMMCGAPNRWAENNGEFTYYIETEEYKQALDIARQMWEDEVIHPDSFTAPASQRLAWMAAGTTAMYRQGYGTIRRLTEESSAANPDARISAMILPKWEGGGQAANHTTNGTYQFGVVLKKSSKERTQELLRVLDWLASPFGTAEHLVVSYGLPGRHYTLDGTDPIVTADGTTEARNAQLDRLTTTEVPIYVAGMPDVVRNGYELCEQQMQERLDDPTIGLYAETEGERGGELNSKINNMVSEVIQGRMTLDEWSAGVDEWRKDGGDQIKQEYAEAWAVASCRNDTSGSTLRCSGHAGTALLSRAANARHPGHVVRTPSGKLGQLTRSQDTYSPSFEGND